MTKEPNKDFRQLITEQVFLLAGSASLCWETKPKGVFDSTQAAKFADEATTRILALCKEMLVPEDIQEEPNHSEHQVSYAIGWNACKSVLLKQLGEK